MNLSLSLILSIICSIPRVSGGEPFQIITDLTLHKYSPRERG